MRRLLASVCVIVFVDTLFYAAITPILPALSEEHGLSKTAAGVLAAAYPAGTFIGALPGGWMAARVGVRPTAQQPEGDSRLRTLIASLGDRRVAAGMWLTALPGLLFGTLTVLGPLRLDELGAGAAAIAAAFLVAAALEAVAAPLIGRLSDRRGRMLPSVLGVAGGGAAML